MSQPDDIRPDRLPGREDADETTVSPPPSRKSVGPESEVRGGPEADTKEETP